MRRPRAKWTLLRDTRRYHDHEFDLIDMRVAYPGGDRIINTYRIRKTEQFIPRDELKSRKVGESQREGSDKPWIEGNVRGRNLKGRRPSRGGR
jgi:hypothetical protein